MSAQVRLGYKLTEVGMIPEDWKVKMLKQISPIQSVGLVINPSSYYDDAGTVPMLVGSNVSENVIDWASSKRISEVSNIKIGATRVFAGDLVTVRVGEPGVTAVIPVEIDGCNCASMMIIRRHAGFDSTWLCFLMNSNFGRMQVENVQYGTAQKQFNISDAVCFSYPVPPLAEQRAIAAALSDMDTMISGLDQLIAKKRDIKQATMQQLLTGQKRLPGFSGEWEVRRLGDVLEKIVGGGTPSRSNEKYWRGEIPWVTVKDFATFNPRAAQETITQEGLKNSASNLIPSETLITSTRMALGKAVIYEVDISINQDLKALFPKTNVCTKFLYYWFENNAAIIDELGSGSTVKGISLGDLKAITFLLSSLEEQIAIATILSDMDSELTLLETRRDKALELKQGMMQELLTGRIRLL
jgi:Restriction endonuclease S subunits